MDVGGAEGHRPLVPFQQAGQGPTMERRDDLAGLVQGGLGAETTGGVHPMGLREGQALDQAALLVDAMAIRAKDQAERFVQIARHVAELFSGLTRRETPFKQGFLMPARWFRRPARDPRTRRAWRA